MWWDRQMMPWWQIFNICFQVHHPALLWCVACEAMGVESTLAQHVHVLRFDCHVATVSQNPVRHGGPPVGRRRPHGPAGALRRGVASVWAGLRAGLRDQRPRVARAAVRQGLPHGTPPPPSRPTNALSNEHFCSDRIFLDLIN